MLTGKTKRVGNPHSGMELSTRREGQGRACRTGALQGKAPRLSALCPQPRDASWVTQLRKSACGPQGTRPPAAVPRRPPLRPGAVPVPPRLQRNVAIRPGAGMTSCGSRGASSCCSRQVGWRPAGLTAHTAWPRRCGPGSGRGDARTPSREGKRPRGDWPRPRRAALSAPLVMGFASQRRGAPLQHSATGEGAPAGRGLCLGLVPGVAGAGLPGKQRRRRA